MVKFLGSMDEYNAMLETSKTKPVIVDFTATWCVLICFSTLSPFVRSTIVPAGPLLLFVTHAVLVLLFLISSIQVPSM